MTSVIDAIRYISVAVKELMSDNNIIINNGVNINGKITSNGTEIVPIGFIVAFAGDTPPPGWAICNGMNGTPNLTNRCIVGSGAGPGLTNRGVGTIMGTENHVLQPHEVPNHNHRGRTTTSGSHQHQHWRAEGTSHGTGKGGVMIGSRPSERTDTVSHNHSVTSAGNGMSHNNMQPYIALNYIMRIK